MALIRAVAFYSLVIYVPLMVQGVLGGTSESARNALTTFAVPVILGAVVAGFLVARNLGYRTLLLAGLALFGTGLWLVGQMGVDTGQAQLLPILALAGLGVGVTQVTIVLALQNSVPVEYMGTASSLAQFFTNLAGTVGVGLLGTYQANVLAKGVQSILASAAVSQLPPDALQILGDVAALSRALTSPEMAARIPPQLLAALRGALASSLQSTFMVGLLLTAVALAVSLFVRGSATQQVGRLSVLGSRVDPPGTQGGAEG